MEKIGFIGLGIMGSRMAANLQKAGFSLVVYNRTASKAESLVANGAVAAESPQAVAAQCATVFTMLSNPETVAEVAFGTNGFVKTMDKGGLWIDCSTVDPAFSTAMHKKTLALGIRFVAAPVAGTKAPAENGELLFFASGEQGDVAPLAPYFEAMGKKTVYMGGVPNGPAIKMLINQLLGQSMGAFAEAIALGKAMGLAQNTLFDVLLATPVTAPFLNLIRQKVESGNEEVNFPLKWMLKDLHLVSQTAYAHQVPMPTLQASKEAYAIAAKQGYAEKDFSAIFDFFGQS